MYVHSTYITKAQQLNGRVDMSQGKEADKQATKESGRKNCNER